MQAQVHIQAIKALNDNYIWLIEYNKKAIVIDPALSKPVFEKLHQNKLTLSAIWITHHHHDHIGGVAELKQAYPECTVYSHNNHKINADIFVDEGDEFECEGIAVQVWKTAGHTSSHLSYLTKIDGILRVFCGDTLFSAGCGRVFDGTIDELFCSFRRFDDLSDQTLFYPAHEYTQSNLEFALSICPPSQYDFIYHYLQQIKKIIQDGGMSLPTSLATERKINLFLQTTNADLVKHLKQKRLLKDCQPQAVFGLLRELKNKF